MHYLMLVTISLPAGATSDDARRKVFHALVCDDSFCGYGGRFGLALADWFEIGGRWSGYLAETAMGNAFREAIIARFPAMAANWQPDSLVSSHHGELDAIWQSHGGDGQSPYTRSSRGELGYPDDAMLLTRELYDALLADFEDSTIDTDGDHCRYVDLDDQQLEPDAVGCKWLVVVDYHR